MYIMYIRYWLSRYICQIWEQNHPLKYLVNIIIYYLYPTMWYLDYSIWYIKFMYITLGAVSREPKTGIEFWKTDK